MTKSVKTLLGFPIDFPIGVTTGAPIRWTAMLLNVLVFLVVILAFFADERSFRNRELFHYVLICLLGGTSMISVIALWPPGALQNNTRKSNC
jgi:hypothetical protein